jgi:superfamily II DNA or RNA helicase
MNDLFPAIEERAPDLPVSHPLLVQLLSAGPQPIGWSRFLELVRRTEVRDAGGRLYSPTSLKADLERAIAQGLVARADNGFECTSHHRLLAFREAAAAGRLPRWRKALFDWLRVLAQDRHWWERARSKADALAVMRLALFTGLEGKALASVSSFTSGYNTTRVYLDAFDGGPDDCLISFVASALRDDVAHLALGLLLERPDVCASAAVEWARTRVAQSDAGSALRYRTCEHMLWQGRFEEALALLANDADPFALALRGAAAAMRRDINGARELFDGALSLLRKSERRRAGLLPAPIAWLRSAALILSGEPAALEEARRYCRAEARADQTHSGVWDALERAAESRLGDVSADSLHLSFAGAHHARRGLAFLVAAEVAAWIKQPLDRASREALRESARAYEAAGYRWIANELAAVARIGARESPNGEHAQALAAALVDEQPWRRVLSAIAALSQARRSDAEDTRLVWMLRFEPGAAVHIEPWEQRRGARGWAKGKKVALSRLVRNDRLAPRDAQVCRAIWNPYGSVYELDMDRALAALVGHPFVFFTDDPATPVELVTAEPELAIVRAKDGVRVVLNPDIRTLRTRAGSAPSEDDYLHINPARKTDRCLLVRDSLTRARVLRVTAAHQRIAELIGEALHVPPEGAEALASAVDSAARFFHVHSDVTAGIPESPADGTLRAELSPVGEGLRMRFSVQPFGDSGPRYAPGTGGARVLGEVSGERRAAVRDLHAERDNAQRAIEALPMLDEQSSAFEWRIDEPEDCLALIEALQSMSELVRVEWPAGTTFRVTRPYGLKDFNVRLNASGEWFVASGGLTLDEGLVLDMAKLVEFARATHGRFVPLGDGGFVALSEELKRRIDELTGIGEVWESALRVHPLAACAIEELADGVNVQTDAAWRTRLERLREAETLEPDVPTTLQAELRPYQIDGYRWLARLAHWGAGACLADDMGLGKTVQTLAVLLRRAPDGPALVVAPTSVCGNWIAEARRFAPTLEVQPFGPGERAKQIAEAGPYALVICSYALLQQEAELFASRTWHTLVLDEAQAVKNFATKRAQAAFALKADFHIATTGTPVENRLEELWTLFRFLNPGLLGSRERFNERFAAPIERNRDVHARARLRRLVRPFVLRRTKSEVLEELPPRTEIAITIEPDEREKALYEALRRDALAAIAGEGVPLERRRFEVLAQLMRLRRACCDPRLAAPGAGVTGAKLDAFTMLVEELVANRHKALVFSQFVDYLALLRAELDRMGVAYQYLDGSTPAAERAKRVGRFQTGEGDVFLISLRAGGFGLNLTAADYVIVTDPWWNPAVEDQAASRAHRMGQERPVTVYRLVVKGSIEERIMALHHEKRALAEGLFGGEEFGAAVSVEELVRLMSEG